MAKLDDISLTRIESMHPAHRAGLDAAYKEASTVLTGNTMLRLAYTIRTFQEQDGLYAKGRTKLFDNDGNRLGIVTNARGGDSYHNYGLAFDIVLLVDKDGNGSYESASWDIKKDFDGDKISDWMEVTNIFKKHGWEWGGTWASLPDAPHFQKTGGLTIKACKAKYLAKDFIPGTTYIKL